MGDNIQPLNNYERTLFIIASILGTCFYRWGHFLRFYRWRVWGHMRTGIYAQEYMHTVASEGGWVWWHVHRSVVFRAW